MTTGCEKSSKFVMASSSSSSQSSSRPLKEWTVKELTEYLRERGVSTSGYNKEKLVKLATAVADLDLPVDPDLSRADTGRSLQEKLARAGCSFTDPTKLAGFTSNFENIPDFGLFDIFNYLILNRTDYDRKKLKGYKSFEDYRLFADGNVVSLQFNEVSSSSSVCVFLAEVRPTQKDRTYLNKSSYQTWVVMNKTTGEINVAFCECQGGSDGGCRHVGAVLYEIEAFNVKSCTDGPAVWKRKPRQHDVATVLTNLTVKKARYSDSSSGSTSALALKKVEFDPRSVGDRGPLNDSEIADFTSGLVKADLSAAAIEFYDVELQQEEPSSFAYDHLMVSNQVAKITSTSDNTLTPSEVAEKMVMTEEEIQDVEEHTRGQAGNQIWHDLRKCRLTASNFKAIASSKKEDGGSLAIRIMDGGALEFEPAAIEWGRKKEKVAVEYYSRVRRQSHRQHKMTQSGLCLLPQKSYIGASPDGIATCKCTSCPDKLVEVKCPFSERESHPKDAARKRGCSDGPDGELTMDSSCQYFAQIQGQMGVCGINQCDLVVYTKKGICVVPVKFDEQYFSDMVSKLEMYFIKIVLPKLLA